MQMASIIVCVDDTDDETRSTSTGKVAEMIASRVVELGGRIRLGITRHQLLLSEDVPYTSHNSSMAFEALVPESRVDELHDDAVKILAKECVETADPGLAIAILPEREEMDEVAQQQIEALVAFGRRAKRVYCPKESAYGVAQGIPWVSLSEHGGDGQGVVGALAGIGLRLSGSDGRFRGKFNLGRMLDGGDARGMGSGDGQGRKRGQGTGQGQGKRNGQGAGQGKRQHANEATYAPVGEVVSKLSKCAAGPVRAVDESGAVLPVGMPVLRDAEVKAVFLGGSFTVVCRVEGGFAIPLSKDGLNDAGDEAFSHACASFEWDNDLEECAGKAETCRNCLHRRWESWGFSCMLGATEAHGE